jgi:hypothetical protein
VKCPDIKKACPGNKAITITTKFANNAAQFKAQQKAFIAGVANAASVSPQQVVITQIKYLYKMSDKEKEQITDPAPMTPEEKAAEEAEAKAEAAAKAAAAAAAAKGPAAMPGDIPEGEWPTRVCWPGLWRRCFDEAGPSVTTDAGLLPWCRHANLLLQGNLAYYY